MQNSHILTSVQEQFLTTRYLSEKYHVPNIVASTAKTVADTLATQWSNTFVGLCIVGGLTNGSYVLRCQEQEERQQTKNKNSFYQRFFSNPLFQPNVTSDVDFYFLVNGASQHELRGMAKVVASSFNQIGFSIDGVLNGKNLDSVFDCSRIEQHIDNEEYDLLSLPFKYVHGQYIAKTQDAIKGAVRKRHNAKDIWEQITFYHDSPLSLYHGTFDEQFMDYVSQVWYPKKVEKFGLHSL